MITFAEKDDWSIESLAKAIVKRHYQVCPELGGRYGIAGRQKCLQDSIYHLTYLTEAVNQGRPEIFVAYVSWIKTLLNSLGVPEVDLSKNLSLTRDVISEELGAEKSKEAIDVLDAALLRLPELSINQHSYITEENPLNSLANEYLKALLERRRGDALKLINSAVESKIKIQDIYLNIFQPVQYEVGRLWQTGKVSVAQEHYCTAATQLIMSQLYQYVFESKRVDKCFVAVCVGDELHEIGVRMVADFMEMAGWDTVYLGANLPRDEIISSVIENNADAVGLSTTIPFHISRVREIISTLRSCEETKGVRILVGGYAFGEGGGDWKASGADGYADNAEAAVRTLGKLCNA